MPGSALDDILQSGDKPEPRTCVDGQRRATAAAGAVLEAVTERQELMSLTRVRSGRVSFLAAAYSPRRPGAAASRCGLSMQPGRTAEKAVHFITMRPLTCGVKGIAVLREHRILVVATVSDTLRAFLTPFAFHFRAQGWQVDALARGATSSDECLRAYDHVWEAAWSRKPTNLPGLVRGGQQVRRIVLSEGYDLVHVHTPVAAFVTRFALRSIRRSGWPRVVYTAHGFHFYEGGSPVHNALYLAIEKLAGRWTDYLVVINRQDEATAKRRRLVPPSRVCYMPGIGVDTELMRPGMVPQTRSRDLRRELGLADTDHLLLMVAEFTPGKRHRDALRAIARLARPEIHLALAGTGPLLQATKRLASELRIAQRVHFLGFRTDVAELILASDATVLPSEREGLPRSVLESLSLGVPVIGTACRGTREVLSDGCGRLVNVGDVDGLAREMAWVIDHPSEASAMAERGRERALTYDIRRVIACHEDLYARALA